MIDERVYSRPEMRLAEWHDAVQALGLDGQDKPLGKRVQVRTPRGQQERLHAAVPQQAPRMSLKPRHNFKLGRDRDLDQA